MNSVKNRFMHLDSVIGWHAQKTVRLKEEVTGRVSTNDFRDKSLVTRLAQPEIIRICEKEPDYIYFNRTISSEEELIGRLKQVDDDEIKLITSIWRQFIQGFTLQKVPGEGKPIKDKQGAFGGLEYPTGLAVDKDGNIYIADTDRHIIKKFDFCKKEFIDLGCLGGEGNLPRQFKSPRGIAVSKNNDLFVADSGNNRIQVFSLKGLVLRNLWGPEGDGDGQFYDPTDVAIDSHGNIYVVDRGNNRIQKFSSNGRFLLNFGKRGEAEGEFQNPTRIAIDGKDRIYVIDDKKYVQVFGPDGEYIASITGPDDVAEFFTPLAIAIDKQGNVYIGEGADKRIYKFCYKDGIEKGPSYSGHSAGFKGETSYLVVDDSGVLYASLLEKGLVAFEPEKDRYEKEGFFIAGPLDSKTYKCQWHRVLLEVDIPEGTSIEVQTYASEKEKDIFEIECLPQAGWSDKQVNTGDFLVLSSPGRYLWLKVNLKGNVGTPVLKAIRVYYPRVSYLQYLPKIYQEDETSRLFLDQFLSIFESLFSGIEEKLDNIHFYFNPLSTPKDFLPWLASWLGLVLDDNWQEEKRRKLIQQAPELYKKRGTLAGLKEYIKIYTGLDSLHIVEHYNLRRWTFLNQSKLGCESAMWGKAIVSRLQLNEHSTVCGFKLISTKDPLMDPFHQYAHRFSVILPSSFCDGEKKERAVRNIVEVEKPAHTQYTICKVGPRFRVGVQSTIGVDTYIGVYSEMILCFRSTLGINSILGESPEEKGPPALRIGKKSRIGVSTLVN